MRTVIKRSLKCLLVILVFSIIAKPKVSNSLDFCSETISAWVPGTELLMLSMMQKFQCPEVKIKANYSRNYKRCSKNLFR